MPDRLNETIGVLTRREVEARLVAPLVEELGKEFGRDRVLRVIRDAVVEIARRQGQDLFRAMGGNSLRHFRDSLVHWTRDDALSIELIEESGQKFAFNVTRCRYAEMYRDCQSALKIDPPSASNFDPPPTIEVFSQSPS